MDYRSEVGSYMEADWEQDENTSPGANLETSPWTTPPA